MRAIEHGVVLPIQYCAGVSSQRQDFLPYQCMHGLYCLSSVHLLAAFAVMRCHCHSAFVWLERSYFCCVT